MSFAAQCQFLTGRQTVVSYKKHYDTVYALAVRYAMREGSFSGYDRLTFNLEVRLVIYV